ncbi:DUF177 domain-containing protein [Enorma burkinafasonensis]|uniref:YceD family protein n=1 Tax=Enorma burkinafasonensis TaxID=2590867 RepID=UPI0026F11738|nr:DUF177 domain-containing protein [Enorma burkinafasonensis]MCI7730401.1 DUF177 domain-containing protein [Enorma burkinafasonensis]
MALFEAVRIPLADHLENPGDSYPLAGTIDAASYRVGDKEFALPHGVSYDVVLTHTGDGVLVTGIVRAEAVGQCDLCLGPAHLDIASEIEEYYLFDEPDDPEAFEDGFDVIGPERTLDLAEAISDAVVLDTPFVVLCKPDCAGLCPTCGCNLNREHCDCAERAREERSQADDNPFAALKDLKFDD